ncbi:MAG: DNA mismatch repair endonuclease MutL [Paramuribaculum sp.]
MSDIIRLLPDSVANQIAAGEVIQRPASVVKELVENAVDAGATSVDVIIRDAGRTLIQVVDNGKGMTETDARMAFERHATSKIVKADDLFSLHTMGFRGEALASICAVAQVELRTRTADAELGTRLEINGSRVEAQEPTACPTGCNMMVKNLFFNVPARRKFLKKDPVEFANITREFERMALVNPDVDFKLIHNDTMVHQLMRGSLKQRISDLYGKTVERQLIPVSTSTSIVSIEGFTGMPEHARRRNALQFLMVNGRHMRHPYFHKAVMMCYEPLIAADQQPNYFLNFTVDPSTIDVNIHPTKNEIKFENEAAIWQILMAAVKEALGRFNAMPGIDFESADGIEIPVFNPNAKGDHSVEIDSGYNPFVGTTGSSMPPSGVGVSSSSPFHRQGVASDWDKLYEGFMSCGGERRSGTQEAGTLDDMMLTGTVESRATAPDAVGDIFDGSDDGNVPHDSTSTIQVRNRFILSASVSGVMVIDQHRAHVKVLYERYLASLRAGNAGVQQVLFPEVIRLSASQNAVLLAIADYVRGIGFGLSFLGDNTWSVTAVPSMLGDVSATETIMHIVEDATDEVDRAADTVMERIALSMARSAAITAGRKLTDAEREHLIGELLRLPSPNYTPDGLPVIRMISEQDLEKLF